MTRFCAPVSGPVFGFIPAVGAHVQAVALAEADPWTASQYFLINTPEPKAGLFS